MGKSSPNGFATVKTPCLSFAPCGRTAICFEVANAVRVTDCVGSLFVTRYLAMAWSPEAARGNDSLRSVMSSRGTLGWPGTGGTRQTTVSPLCVSVSPSEKVTVVFPITLYIPVAVPAGTVTGTEYVLKFPVGEQVGIVIVLAAVLIVPVAVGVSG